MPQIKIYSKSDSKKTTMVEQSTWDKFKTNAYRQWTDIAPSAPATTQQPIQPTSQNIAQATSRTPIYGTQQDLANKGYQVSGNQVYSNGKVIGNYGGESEDDTTPTPTPTMAESMGVAPEEETSPAGGDVVPTESINALYQKYFGRDATTEEANHWRTQGEAALEAQLLIDYNAATGLNGYDGSPVTEGNNQTDNQIAGTPGETLGETPTGTGEINTQAAHAVNQMYQKYFNRDATTGPGGELEFWTTQPLSELEAQLFAEYQNVSGHEYDGSPIAEGNRVSNLDLESDKSLADGMAILDQALADGTLPKDVYEIWKLALENYPPGVEFDAANIIGTFERIQESTIDPYFDELIAIAKSDIQTSFDAMKGARGRELEAEGVAASERIKGEKSRLEASGMTFTGEAAQRLGEESTFSEGGNVPFGGELPEGFLPTQNRLIASSTEARHKSDVRGLVSRAKGLLGSEAVGGMNLPGIDRPGVKTTGEIDEARSAKEGSVLQKLIDQQNAISGLNTINNI